MSWEDMSSYTALPLLSRPRSPSQLLPKIRRTMAARSVLTWRASHGFMVAAIQHFSESVWPWDGYDGIAFIAYNRPRDISFALTELLKRNGKPGDLLFGTIDDRHLVSSGHSYGGYAALVEV